MSKREQSDTFCVMTEGATFPLKKQDIAVLQALHKALKVVSEFTDILSGESFILPMLEPCRGDVLSVSDKDIQLTKEIKKKQAGGCIQK